MELERRLNDLIAGELETLGYELLKIDAALGGRNKVLRIYIDRSEGGVSLDDCVKVTRAIGFVLDGEDVVPGPYKLEVSSPGINRPITRPEHYRRFRGVKARIELVDGDGPREVVTGEIGDSDDEGVSISDGGVERKVSFKSIVKANLQEESWKIPKKERTRRKARGRR
jgi:ribosome maturation factor RimP